jgi:hypothetical protein
MEMYEYGSTMKNFLTNSSTQNCEMANLSYCHHCIVTILIFHTATASFQIPVDLGSGAQELKGQLVRMKLGKHYKKY